MDKYFNFLTAFLSFVAAGLTLWGILLKRENNRLNQFNIRLQQDYSKNYNQLIQIKKGETKREYSSKQLMLEHFPTLIYYVYFLFYLLTGWTIGCKFDVFLMLKGLFKSEVIFYNPQFWIFLSVFIFLILLPLKLRKIIFDRFPYPYIEKTVNR